MNVGLAKKVGKRIKELERIYGVREGSFNKKGINQYVGKPNYSARQSDIATQLGISVETLQNYKALSEMIPELDELWHWHCNFVVLYYLLTIEPKTYEWYNIPINNYI